MKIYLVRHGETIYNKKGLFQGQTDIPLDEDGKLQARKAGLRFNDEFIKSGETISAIYTSPLSRTRETAEIIGENFNIKPQDFPSFKEINMGEWEGKSAGEVMEKYKDSDGTPLLKKWKEDPLNYHIPGGEKVQDVDRRVVDSINDLIKKHRPEDNLIIVTHGGPIGVVICHALHESLKEVTKKKADNTSVTVVETQKDINSLKLLIQNDTSHLNTYLSPYIS